MSTNKQLTTTEQKLIKAGVNNLHEFGYPGCNEENILTDKIYSAFFVSMLKDNYGKGVDSEIDSLRSRVEPAKANVK